MLQLILQRRETDYKMAKLGLVRIIIIEDKSYLVILTILLC